MTLYLVSQNGKYGFIFEDGSIAIQPQFESAMMFAEGLAGIKRDGKWGFINESGELAIPPRFDSCRGFSHGLALVESDGSKLYVDRSGEVVIRTSFYECGSFEGDLARVMPDILSKGAFIDRTGKIVLSGRDYYVSHYSHGLINCREEKKWGFINGDGEFVIPPKYAYARPFSEGLAAVALRRAGQFSFIDTKGQIVIEGKFQGADIGFSGNLCAVWDKFYGFIDRAGCLVIPYRFYYADGFSEGLAVIQEPESEFYGYADETGTIVIRPSFRLASAFNGKLARVTVGETFDSYQDG